MQPKHTHLKKGRYRHFKGNDYFVVDIARHCESEEVFVVYRALYGEGGLWLRPLNNFVEQVPVEGRLIPRFQWVGES